MPCTIQYWQWQYRVMAKPQQADSLDAQLFSSVVLSRLL